MATTREVIREKVIDQLYAGKGIVRSTTTSVGTTSTLIDTQLVSGMFEMTDFIGAYVLFSSGKTDSTTNINETGPFSQGDTTLTVISGTPFTVGNYIQIEDEFLEVTNIAANDLTVVRGILGTTDVQHTDDTDVFISTDMQAAKIIAYDRVTGGTLTLSPVLRSVSDTGADYEIHYDLHPFRVEEAIVWAIEVGTRNALTAPTTDIGTTTLDVETIVEGALSYCKFAIADQTDARDPASTQSNIDKEEFRKQAVIHETNWIRGLSLAGYRPFIVSQRAQEDQDISEEG